MTTSELLSGTKRELEKGWCKHSLISRTNDVCMNGAICVAAAGGVRSLDIVYRLDWNRPELKTVMDLVRRLAPGADTVGYNNAPETTYVDIMAWIDAAIAIVESQEQAQGVREVVRT